MVVKKIMEINTTALNSYITIYDDIFPKETSESFTRVCELQKDWDQSTVVRKGGAVVDTETRNTLIWELNNIHGRTKTEIHWSNLFIKTFKDYTQKYKEQLKIENFPSTMESVQVLKYTPGCFFTIHTDHCAKIPRTLSYIYLVNNNFKGGELTFTSPPGDKTLKIENKKNRLIIWPSNFLYPHYVTPVEEGIRYSVVGWAL